MPADRTPLVAVLAAGRASRFGGGKLDAECGGKPLGQWALDAVAGAGLEPGLIVVGPDAPRFARQAEGWHLLVNPDPAAGQGGSVALAARAALAQERDLLLLLADMPLVEPAHLRRLAASESCAATGYPDGRAGVPVCIVIDDLEKWVDLDGEQGARSVLPSIVALEVVKADPDSLLDVDTPEALAQAAAKLRSS